ncbi:TetR/AcrR family transcriptional regulator [Conexibacter woesei]|uniref:Transcriptional regulator, TetR family n=1 Tax=Conexibacter woesei (strain DSM 14684 / CCUG 47730 / CIP 108061 / JCM 11494 / NBRC 100937 / ID131577) TaxID=469383 RepID=D3F490_CONWI|nr:TetR/AcrR family transcriptional regulator [Conexibacter woesei]ADB50462.1 transcriptional regulator, TetR family [Conexibacter woesei DSM 14684]
MANAPDTNGGHEERTGRQRLLEAAIEVVARSGYEALSYRSVAKQAGVTHGLVHYHFGQREALLAEARAYAAAKSVASQIFEDEDVLIDEFALGLSRVVAAEPDLAAFQIALDLHGRLDPELRSDSKRHWERYLAATEAALERVGIAADPAITHMVLATLTGLVLIQLSFSSPAETDRAVRALQGTLTLLREQAGDPVVSRERS